MERRGLGPEELERKLRAYFRQETADIAPSEEWWDQALADLGEQERPWRLSLLPAVVRRITRRVPLPAVAAAAASLVLVLTATVMYGGRGDAALDPASTDASPGLAWNLGGVPGEAPAPAASTVLNMAARASGETEGTTSMVADFAMDGFIPMREPATGMLWDSAAGGEEPRQFLFSVTVAEATSPCPERETAEALRANAFAFDGTVLLAASEPSPPRVTFEVNRWLKGGDSRIVTVRMSSRIAGIEAVELGQRWLVTGNRNDQEQPRSGRCSMTRPHTEDARREWTEALSE